MTEFRNSPDLGFHHSVRADDKVKGQVEIDVCPYNVVDGYNTRWLPGVFNESIEKRSPPMCFGHSWLDPIGHMVDKDDSPLRLHALYQLDNFDDVPRARQVYSQIRSGTLTDTSFGFERVEGGEEEPDVDGVVNFRKSTLQEVSPVLIGAVPGARPTGTRQVSAGEVLSLARQLEAGEMTLDEGYEALDAITRQMHSHARTSGGIVNHSHVSLGPEGMHAHSGMMPAVRLGRSADKHSHAMEGGGSFNHSHDEATSGHGHGEDAKGNASGAQLLPMRSAMEVFEQAVADEPENMTVYQEPLLRADGPPAETAATDGPQTCPTCQAKNNADASYCDQCGKSLGVKSLAEGEARALLADIADRD